MHWSWYIFVLVQYISLGLYQYRPFGLVAELSEGYVVHDCREYISCVPLGNGMAGTFFNTLNVVFYSKAQALRITRCPVRPDSRIEPSPERIILQVQLGVRVGQ